jgi:hypothetical protein
MYKGQYRDDKLLLESTVHVLNIQMELWLEWMDSPDSQNRILLIMVPIGIGNFWFYNKT